MIATMIAVHILVANTWILMVEITVCLGAPLVDAFSSLLDEEPVSALYVVGQHTLLTVGDGEVEEQTLGTKHLLGSCILAEEEFITLGWVREFTVFLWTVVVRGGEFDEVLRGGEGQQEEEDTVYTLQHPGAN